MKCYKATALSPANIAFIKYWGWQSEKDKALILPANDSISMNLHNCFTKTTVAFSPSFIKDRVKIKFFGKSEKDAQGEQLKKVIDQVARIRKMSNISYPVHIISHNVFPADSGIASSASAFSALTRATVHALGFDWDKKKLSIETRLSGSGSACRSLIDGFAYWQKGQGSDSSYAYQLKNETWWDLADIVVVVSSTNKKKSSRQGHALAITSSYFKSRLEQLSQRVEQMKQAIEQKDFKTFGMLLEEETVSMHTVCMTCQPPIFYWNHATLEIIQTLRDWRKEGLFAYFTIDAGPNVHVICQKKDVHEINKRLTQIKNVLFTIINYPCKGTRLIDDHLF